MLHFWLLLFLSLQWILPLRLVGVWPPVLLEGSTSTRLLPCVCEYWRLRTGWHICQVCFINFYSPTTLSHLTFSQWMMSGLCAGRSPFPLNQKIRRCSRGRLATPRHNWVSGSLRDVSCPEIFLFLSCAHWRLISLIRGIASPTNTSAADLPVTSCLQLALFLRKN